MTVRGEDVAADEKRGAEQRRRRQHDAMIGADHQPDQVRDDDADETDRAADRDRGAGRQRRAEEREPLRARDVDAARLGAVGAQAEQVERTRQPGERRRTRRTSSGSAVTSG